MIWKHLLIAFFALLLVGVMVTWGVIVLTSLPDLLDELEDAAEDLRERWERRGK